MSENFVFFVLDWILTMSLAVVDAQPVGMGRKVMQSWNAKSIIGGKVSNMDWMNTERK